MALRGNQLSIDVSHDGTRTAAIVLVTKGSGGTSAVFIRGGSSAKNLMLQSEPQMHEVLGIDGKGHDCFLQITDACPDTSCFSGATSGEAVSLGKSNPDRLPDAIVCYMDSTIGLPLITAYTLAKHLTPLTRPTNARTPCWMH